MRHDAEPLDLVSQVAVEKSLGNGLRVRDIRILGSFVEVNLSQMLAYTIYRGLVAGLLPDEYEKPALALKQAAAGKVDRFGLVQGVCGSPHFDRPGVAAEGQAFYLLLDAAAQRWARCLSRRKTANVQIPQKFT